MNTIQEVSKNILNIPIIGKGATIYDSQNKFAYEVLEVNPSGDEVILKRYIPTRIDSESPFSSRQSYEFRRLGLSHIRIKRWNGIWKMENRHTKRWESVKIVFGIKEEFCDLVA